MWVYWVYFHFSVCIFDFCLLAWLYDVSSFLSARMTFFCIFMMILFYLIFLSWRRNALDSVLYIYLPPKILFSLNIFFIFLCFWYWHDHFLRDPNYMTRLHLKWYKCLSWYFLFLVHIIRRFCLSTWHHELIRYVWA